MNYKSVIDYINSRLSYGIKPGLDRIKELLDRMGNPQKKLNFVHVAGTNGKGSVSSMIASCASCAGYKTGLFTSPYISDFCDRIMINGNMIPHNTLAEITQDISLHIGKMDNAGNHVTEFELITAIALEWFSRENCDLVVLEAGLGGMEDSTNVIDSPEVAVITKIALDHMNILGSTIEEIAEKKCGIIKNGTTTVTYPAQNIDALEVIFRQTANKNGRIVTGTSPKVISTSLNGTVMEYGEEQYEISMGGDHQPFNAVTAIEAINILKTKGYNIDSSSIKKGLKRTVLPARLEVISKSPLIILDGSHNVNGISELCTFINTHLSGKKLNAVIGMLADKQVEEAMKMIAPMFNSIITVAPQNPRAMSANALQEVVCKYNINVKASENVITAVEESGKECDGLIILGSLYLAGEIRPYLIEKH